MGFYDELTKICGKENVRVNEPMSRHTTFRIGGPADYFAAPADEEAIRRVFELGKAAGVPVYIIGNGSNLLVGDQGFRGVILQIGRNLSKIRIDGCRMCAQAGVLLSKAAAAAADASLSGLEFASGIPGTLGGAVRMNAGAYGGEMKQVLIKVKVLTQQGEVQTIPAQQMELGYRTSLAAKRKDIILEAELNLRPGDAAAIRAKMDELKEKRALKQPLEYPSAGSTFKRPQGYFAGKLIDEAGLRGYRVGDAQVSEKHCGFVINRGNASAKDVEELMEQVQKRVFAHSGVRLEPEIEKIGE